MVARFTEFFLKMKKSLLYSSLLLVCLVFYPIFSSKTIQSIDCCTCFFLLRYQYAVAPWHSCYASMALITAAQRGHSVGCSASVPSSVL